MSKRDRIIAVSTALFFVLALAATHLWLTAHHWLPAVDRRVVFVPAPELALVALLAIAAAAARRPYRLLAAAIPTVLLAALGVFSVADGALQQVWQRGFIPQSDFRLVRGGLLLLLGEIGSIVDLLAPVTIVLTALASVVAAAVLVVGLGAVPSMLGRRGQLGLAGAFGILLALSVTFGSGEMSPSRVLAERLREGRDTEIQSLSADELIDREGASRTEELSSGAADGETRDYALPGIKDRDLYVFVLESYGYAAYSREALYRELQPTFSRVERNLSDDGFGIVSHYLVSPVSGGRSWMAEATFLSGQRINRQVQYDALLDSDAETLPSWLGSRGYHTLMVRPGTVHGDWPEGRSFYDLDETMLGWGGDFGYTGPDWSFVPVPDQFAVWKAHRRIQELSTDPSAGPLFVNFQLVSSHTPFNRVPEYIEDWTSLGDGSIYHSTETKRFDNNWTGGSEYDEGYVAAMEYSLTVVSEYMTELVPQESEALYIVYGDHQPLRPVREADARLSVPIHIISRDRELLRPFMERGFVRGLQPNQEPPHPDMEAFFPSFARIAEGAVPTGAIQSENGAEPEPAP